MPYCSICRFWHSTPVISNTVVLLHMLGSANLGRLGGSSAKKAVSPASQRQCLHILLGIRWYEKIETAVLYCVSVWTT